VNQLIAVMAGEGEDAKAAASGASAASAPAPKAAEAPKATEAPKPAAPQPAAKAEAAAPAPASNGHDRIFSSPLARRLAKEAGIDLARIAGSGPHGRVVARDVEGARQGKGLKAPGPVTAAAPVPSIAPAMSDDKVLAPFEP